MLCVRSSFYLFLTQTATLKVRAIFNVPESTALCIFRSASVLLPPTSLCIVTSNSRDHPPRASIMMLYCFTSYPGNCYLSSQRRGQYLRVFSLSFLCRLLTHEQLISRACHNSLALMVYNTYIHPTASDLLLIGVYRDIPISFNVL